LATQKNIQRNKKAKNVTASLNSFAINILIFLLLTVIIYLSYSLFIKLNKKEITEAELRNSGKPAEIIQVEVLNGCGVSGIADRFTDYLRDNNVDVVKTGNYIQFDIDETIVIDRIGNKANSDYVAELLNVRNGNSITQINNDYFVDVTVIIGRNYFKQSPIKKD
jgi:hypothetical protein